MIIREVDEAAHLQGPQLVLLSRQPLFLLETQAAKDEVRCIELQNPSTADCAMLCFGEGLQSIGATIGAL